MEEQLVNGVHILEWSRGDLMEVKEWDRIHTLPNVSYV